MSHQRPGSASAFKGGYYELKDQEDDPRSFLDSSSLLLPKPTGEFDGEADVPPATLDTEGLETFYTPIDDYEGAHRYDPAYTWDPKDEKAVVWKVDKWICAWALSDNMLDDLGLNTNDFNYGQAVFYFSFLFAELPSQLISKAIGPERWIPIQMISWSIVASYQSLLTGRVSFYLCRSLIGLIEGGFIPDNILYLSYFYTGSELPARLSWFWVSSQSTNIISAFLAYGILHLRGVYGIAGWRWLFAIEGSLTGFIGVLSFFYLPPSPTQTRGWFTIHEEKIMVNRILRDDPSKGDMHNRQALSLQMIKDCLTDWHMAPIYIIALSFQIPTIPMTAYLTLQLRAIGFDTFQTNLLVIPAYMLFIFQLLFWTWVSEKINQRFLVGLVSQIWALPFITALEFLPGDANIWAKYLLTALLVGHPYVHAILVAITSRNAGTVRTRTVASALYNMTVQFSSIIAQNIYRDDDRPSYRRANKILMGACVYNIALFIGAKAFYSSINKKRSRIWDSMTQEERQGYLATTKDKGNKRYYHPDP